MQKKKLSFDVRSHVIQEVEKPPAEPTREEQLQNQLSQQLNLPSLQDSSAAPAPPPPPEQKVCTPLVQSLWELTAQDFLINHLPVTDENLGSNDPRNSRVGDGDEAVQGPQVRIVPIRRVVHGLWYWSYLHLPLLALARLRRFADSLRRCLGHQSYLRDLCLFLQL